MYFYLDGYNLIFHLIDSKQPLSAQRQHLILFLKKQFSLRSLKGTLVFDGAHRREEESGLSYQDPLEIAYAPQGQSADSYIIEKIEATTNRKQITVVTNDRGLMLHARTLGAKVQDNGFFIHFLRKKSIKTKTREVVETEKNMERLLKIFEERLKKGPDQEEFF